MEQTLTAELRTGRLVTLTGSGGIGKTRVALEVARLLEGEFAMGARWVDLSAVGDSQVVPGLVLAAIGGQDLEAFVSITDRLHSFWYLAARQGECCNVVGPMLETLAAQGRHEVRAHLLSRHAMALALAGYRTGAGEPVLGILPSAIEKCFAADDLVSVCWGAYAVKLADIGAPFQFAELAVVASDAGSKWAWFWQSMAERISRAYFTAYPFDGRNTEDLLRAGTSPVTTRRPGPCWRPSSGRNR